MAGTAPPSSATAVTVRAGDERLSPAASQSSNATWSTTPAPLAEVLFAAFGTGLVQFHVEEPAAAFEVIERPVASPWARYKAATGRAVNLYHQTLRLDAQRQAILPLLDGEHTLEMVAEALRLDPTTVRSHVVACAELGLLIG